MYAGKVLFDGIIGEKVVFCDRQFSIECIEGYVLPAEFFGDCPLAICALLS